MNYYSEDETANEDIKLQLNTKSKNTELLAARKKLGLRQEDVAKSLGIAGPHYCVIECMKVYPSPKLQFKIQEFYALYGIIIDCESVFPSELKKPGKYTKSIFGKSIEPKSILPLDSLEETLLPQSTVYSDSSIILEDLKSEIDRQLLTIKEKEADIVKMFYGLEPYEKTHTSIEIGNKYKQTRQNISAILDRSIRKLRHQSRSKSLREYLGDYINQVPLVNP